MPTSNRPSSEFQPNPGQVFAFNGDHVNYRTLLFNIFMHPKLAMALFAVVNRYWLMTLCTILLLCMVGGCGIAMSHIPNYATDIRQTTDFLLNTVGPITIQQGKLNWEPTAEGTLPATAHLPHLRVDIVETRSDFNAHETGDDVGLVVAHDGLHFWRKLDSGNLSSSNDGSTIPEATIPPAMLQNFPPLSGSGADAETPTGDDHFFVFSRHNQSQVCKLVFLSLFFASAIESSIDTISSILISALLLTLTIAFIIRIRHLRSFFALLLFALNATIPAALAAIIYLVAELGSDFQSVFTIMLGIYMIYSLIEGRNGTIIFPPQK
ncbi:MAG: hypothetical protein IJJ33_18095 [Victivallales bacterium]|nr:hypothetical protein [Victivallales bacterium]MBQ6473905.1 hypothetical protein [Victivallales bacterium]